MRFGNLDGVTEPDVARVVAHFDQDATCGNHHWPIM